ncbi:MAG: glycosyltransferase [Candidatus Omnitrophica bacterium]|nr:glycosyltransferase [Candidatus Omnitrophota bacterium]
MIRKIRILFINATCERGGGDINTLRLIKHLNKEEFEVFLVVPYEGTLFADFKQAGAHVLVSDMPRIRLFRNPLAYWKVLFKFFPTTNALKRIIIKQNIDIICTTSMMNPYGALAAYLARRPHIVSAGEYVTFARLMASYFFRFSDAIICCSHMVASLFQKSDKVAVLHPSVDLDEFDIAKGSHRIKDELGITTPLVSMVSRLAAWKGLEKFIDAAALLTSPVTCVIFGVPVLGKERYVRRLEKKIAAANLQDKVKIVVNKQEFVSDIISSSDIIVHASLRPEPFGLIIVEAMAMAKPVIAFDSGGPREIISHKEDGLLVKQNDVQALASAIEELLGDPDRAKMWGRYGRLKVEAQFDSRQYASRFQAIARAVCKNYPIRLARARYQRSMRIALGRFFARTLMPLPRQKTEPHLAMIERALVVQLFGMGDLACSLPLLRRLRSLFPQARIDMLADERYGDFIKCMTDVVSVVPYGRGVMKKLALLRLLRRGRYDLVVVLNPLFQGAWIAFASGARYRIGYARDYENIQNIGAMDRLLTHALLPEPKPMHDSQRYQNIAEVFKAHVEIARDPYFVLPQHALDWAQEFLQQQDIESSHCIVGVHPGAGWESRCWPSERFAQVADYLVERYAAKIMLFGSAAASDMVRAQAVQLKMKYQAHTCAGKTDVARFIALLRRCRFFITNDSGPMHLAAMLGIPMVAIFGPGDIDKFGYQSPCVVNVAIKDCFYAPCMLNYQYKQMCKENVCLDAVGVEQVIHACDALCQELTKKGRL